MTATRGPVPKRSDQRRRVNQPEVPIEKAAAGARPSVPEPSETWHPMARDWFLALAESGQSRFYEASDWQMARVAAEILSRMLENSRISAQLVSAWMPYATALLTTEGDRRRMRLELERGGVDEDAERASAFVSDLTARLKQA